MKKAVRRSTGITPSSIQAAPVGTVNTVTTAKPDGVRPQQPLSTSPTPVWSRYVDSRLKQFCLR
jgi:hypothetical protein